MTPDRPRGSSAIAVALALTCSAAQAQVVELTKDGLVVDHQRLRSPVTFYGRGFVLVDPTSCHEVNPTTGAQLGPTRSISRPTGATLGPLVVRGPDGEDAVVLVWFAESRLFWLKTRCSAGESLTASSVPLPALPAGVSYGLTGAAAVLPDGRVVVDVLAHVVAVNPGTNSLEVLSSLEDWRVQFIPAAERHLLNGFSVKALAATPRGELWALLQRNSGSANSVMDLWLLRRSATASGWEVLFEEHAGGPIAQRLQLIPLNLAAPMMVRLPGEAAVMFVTRTHWEPGFSAVFLDTRLVKAAAPFPRAAWRHEWGLTNLVPGTDHLWTIASPLGTLNTSLRYAPVVANAPGADVDRDGLSRALEQSLGSSDFSLDSDADSAMDAIEAWRGGAPGDAGWPAPSASRGSQLAISTRVMEWNRYGAPFQPHQTVPGAYCLGNEALQKTCPRWANRCTYAGYLCSGPDGERVGPDDVPQVGHAAFLSGTRQAWFRKQRGGRFSLQRLDGSLEQLDGLEFATHDTWSIVAAVSEDELWVWRPETELVRWRRGEPVLRTSAANVEVLGYSPSLRTLLLTRIWPGEEFFTTADGERYVFAVDESIDAGQRALGTARQWGGLKASWLRDQLGTNGHVLGVEGQSLSVDEWWRPQMRFERAATPSFAHDAFRNGYAAGGTVAFWGPPLEFSAGECPPWVDPLTCGNPALQNLPILHLASLHGELLPVPPRVLPGDVVLSVTSTINGHRAPADSLWLHREDGAVHPWLAGSAWFEAATPLARTSLEAAPRIAARGLAFSSDLSRLCVVADDGRLFEWQLSEGVPRAVELLETGGVRACAYGPGNARFVATNDEVRRQGGASLPLADEFSTLGLQVAPGGVVLVHEVDNVAPPQVRCLNADGTELGRRHGVAAFSVDRGDVSWIEPINTLDQMPMVSTRGAGWGGTLEDFCKGQPREHLAQGSGAAPEELMSRLHTLAGMLPSGEPLKVLRGALAGRPDGVLLVSSIEPRTRVRGTGSSSACECVYAIPQRLTPSYAPLQGTEPLAANEPLRRGVAVLTPIHPAPADVVAMATAPGHVAPDYGRSSRFDCWNGGCAIPLVPEASRPDAGPAPVDAAPTQSEPPQRVCGCAATDVGPAVVGALSLFGARSRRRRVRRPRRREASVAGLALEVLQVDEDRGGEHQEALVQRQRGVGERHAEVVLVGEDLVEDAAPLLLDDAHLLLAAEERKRPQLEEPRLHLEEQGAVGVEHVEALGEDAEALLNDADGPAAL